MIMRLAIAAFVLCASLATGMARAQEAGFYFGAGIGQAEHENACEGANISCDEKDSAWKIFVGYQFNRHIAAEVGYSNLGESQASGVVGSITVDARFQVTAWEALAVGSFPVMNRLSVIGKAGLYLADVELGGSGTVGATTVPVSEEDSNTGFTFGFGVRYDFTRNLGLRAEWQHYNEVGGDDTGESDVSVLSVALILRF